MINLSIPQIPVPQTNNGYTFNMQFFMHLGMSESYGNLSLKNMDYAQRHHYINELIREIYFDHSLEKSKIDGDFYTIDNLFFKVKNSTENVIYWLRKTADDYISLSYLIYYLYVKRERVGQFLIDSIGSLLYGKNDSEVRNMLKDVFKKHLETLRILNEVSNSYKHSFANHELIHLIGKDEPTVIELNANKNDFSKPLNYNSYSLKWIIQNYIGFYLDAETQIKKWSGEVIQKIVEAGKQNE
jgi:hypothetical protein